MSWRRIGLITAYALPFLIFAAFVYRPACWPVRDYVFTAEAARPSLSDGEATELMFAFFPVRDRRMTFHAAPYEQFYLWSSEPIENKPPVILPKRTSPKKIKIYGKARPLTISVPVTRKDQGDGTVLLEFGKFGTISTQRDSTIKLGSYLYPATCYLDSGEGFGSNKFTLHLE